ncbi:MAG: exosporium glycoprotein BclB-related protein [Solibacillus sp.]
MCNCMNRGCSGCSGHGWQPCGNQCFSLGPFRAASAKCPTPNVGSIIPFSSGTVPVILTTTAGVAATVSAVGFGTAITGLAVSATTPPTITLPDGDGQTEAFSVPRNGRITAISATFTPTADLAAFTGTGVITAQIYRAPAGSSTFTATNAFVNLTPTITGPVTSGTLFSGTADMVNVPVAAGDRLVMVFSLAGGTDATTLTGAATAGITIS